MVEKFVLPHFIMKFQLSKFLTIRIDIKLTKHLLRPSISGPHLPHASDGSNFLKTYPKRALRPGETPPLAHAYLNLIRSKSDLCGSKIKALQEFTKIFCSPQRSLKDAAETGHLKKFQALRYI